MGQHGRVVGGERGRQGAIVLFPGGRDEGARACVIREHSTWTRGRT